MSHSPIWITILDRDGLHPTACTEEPIAIKNVPCGTYIRLLGSFCAISTLLCFFKGQSLLLNYHLNLIFQLSRSLHYNEGFLYTVILPSAEYDMHSVTFKITTGFSTSSSTFDWFLLRSDQDIGAREGLAELYVLLLPEELEEP